VAEAEAGIRTSLKDRVQTVRGLREVKSEVEGVGRSAHTSGRLAKSSSLGFDALRKSGKLAATAVAAGFGAALTAGYATVRLLRSSFDEAREAQKVGALTNAVIKSTGGVAHVSAKQVGNLSTRMSEVVGMDDELIQSGGNLLLTFKNVHNEAGRGNKIYKQALKAAVNLSAAGFGSVQSGAKMLGKALNDPIKGLTALGRAGVTFTADQVKRIKTLVDHNKLLEAQKIIIGEVKSEVGGAAAAQATWGDKANVMWKNIEENLGTTLLPLLDDVEKWFVSKGGPKLDHWVGIFESKGVPAIRDFADKARPVAERILPKIGDLLGTAAHDLKAAAPYAEDLLNAFVNMPGWARKALVGGGLAAYVGSKTGITSAINSLARSAGTSAVSRANPLPVVVTNPGFGSGTGAGGFLGGSSDERRGRLSRAGRAGNTIAANVGIVLGPTLADQLAQDIVWPWQEGPFSNNEQGNAIDRFVQHLAGKAPDTGPSSFFKQIEAEAKQAQLQALLTGQSLDKVHNTTMKTYFKDLTTAGMPVTTPIDADTSKASAKIQALYGQLTSLISDFNIFASSPAPTPADPTAPKVRRPQPPGHPAPAPDSRSSAAGPGMRIEIPVMIGQREFGRAVYDTMKSDLADR
jgi:hypothetical protein